MKGLPEMGDDRQTIASEAAIRSQLATILASSPFASALRSRRFLEYVINQRLAGCNNAIKETVIALEVFDRKLDFDPRLDAIVRVEATKLRARLAEFYGAEGVNAVVVIEIPKGSYVPLFSFRAEIPDSQDASNLRPSATPAAAVTMMGVGPAKSALILVGLILAGAGLWFGFRHRPSAVPSLEESPAIAVLPFLNLSGEPGNAYFSDGLADQLTDALTRVDGLHVASRTSAFSFRDKPLGAVEIGTKLKVSSILEGSVQRSKDRMRITLQLIRTRDGYHLWSQTFDREFKDIFDVQDEISRAVTHALKVSLADESSRRVFRRYTTDPSAYDLYLRGRQFLNNLEPGGSRLLRNCRPRRYRSYADGSVV